VAGATLWSASKSLLAANLPFLLLAYGQVMVTGAVLGTRRAYDLYLLAWMLPELALFGVGNILQMHTIPALHAIEHDSGAEAYWQANWAVLIWFGGFSLAAALFCAAAAPMVFPKLFPTLNTGELEQTIFIFQALLVTMWVSVLVKILGNLHRASHSMWLTAASQSAVPLAVILWLWAAPGWGVWALWSGLTLGASIQAALLGPALCSWGLLKHRLRCTHPMFKDLARKLPILLVVAIGFRLLLAGDRLVAAQLAPGSVAVLRYAVFLLLAGLNLFTMPLLNVFFNRFSILAARGCWPERADLLLTAMEIFWLVLLPFSLLIGLFAAPLVTLVLGRGAIGPSDVERIAMTLRVFAPVLPLASWSFVTLAAYTSRRSYGYPCILGILLPGLNLVLGFWFSQWAGLAGIAAATGICLTLWAALLVWPLSTDLPRPRLGRFGRNLVRSSVGPLLACGVVVAINRLFPAMDGLLRAVALAGVYAALAGAGLYLFSRDHIGECLITLKAVRVGR
jgi:peptidoglycan biosynthesis protein MviN/MurJ (putative lipid II flippase)